MKIINSVFISFCILFIAAFFSVPSYAQATRTWVSGVGDDVNPCSRTAPCKTFAGAISKTAVAGEINCIDSGGFGAVTITKSITIRCIGVVGGILGSGTNGVTVNAAATDLVTLSGLEFEGAATGLNGIRFLAGGTLHVENCMIHGFRAASPNGNGILFAPSAGNAELIVSNSVISDNGDGTNGAGILILPTGTATVRATVSRTSLSNNTNGFVSNTGALTTSGITRLTVTDSVASGNNTTTGNTGVGVGLISAATLNSVNRVLVLNSTIANNGVGLSANGQGSGILAALNGINGNNVGVSGPASGQLFTYGNNFTHGNPGGDGAFTTTLPQS